MSYSLSATQCVDIARFQSGVCKGLDLPQERVRVTYAHPQHSFEDPLGQFAYFGAVVDRDTPNERAILFKHADGLSVYERVACIVTASQEMWRCPGEAVAAHLVLPRQDLDEEGAFGARMRASPAFVPLSAADVASLSPRALAYETFFAFRELGVPRPIRPPTMEDARRLLVSGKYDPGMPTVTAAPTL